MITFTPSTSPLAQIVAHHAAFARAISAEIERINTPAKAVLAAVKFDIPTLRNPLHARR